MVAMVSGPFCPILAKWPVLAVSRGSGGPKPRKVLWSLWSPSCLVIKVLWSGLWSGYGRYGQWSLLFNFGPFWRPPGGRRFCQNVRSPPCPKMANLSVSTGSGGAKIPKSAMVTMVTSCFSPKCYGHAYGHAYGRYGHFVFPKAPPTIATIVRP